MLIESKITFGHLLSVLCPQQSDILLVIDNSGLNDRNTYNTILNFLADTVATLPLTPGQVILIATFWRWLRCCISLHWWRCRSTIGSSGSHTLQPIGSDRPAFHGQSGPDAGSQRDQEFQLFRSECQSPSSSQVSWWWWWWWWWWWCCYNDFYFIYFIYIHYILVIYFEQANVRSHAIGQS